MKRLGIILCTSAIAMIMANTGTVYSKEIDKARVDIVDIAKSSDNKSYNILGFRGNFISEQTIVGMGIDNPDKVSKGIKSLDEQVLGLFRDIAKELGIPVKFIQSTYLVAGCNIAYDTATPDIYNTLTSKSLGGAFDIQGASQDYDRIYYNAKLDNKSVERVGNGRYYLPDAVYNVMYDIVEIMNSRRDIDRGDMQDYYDNLLPDVRENILYYEAMMQYAGFSEQSVNRLYNAYEKLVYSKDINEYIVEVKDSTYQIKDKFRGIFKGYEIGRTDLIAKMLSFDEILAKYSSIDALQMQVLAPYKIGYTSRQNMMQVALSVVGKVRYVWGGGHGGTSNINGISPIWLSFNELYEIADKDSKSIQNSNTWCPVHGDCGYACSMGDNSIRTVEDYISLRGNLIKDTPSYKNFKTANLSKIFSNRNVANTDNTGNGIKVSAHRVEGLDCSGYISWVYNQIDKSRVYDSNASNFVNSSNLREISFGDKLYAGDVIAWSSHICLVVGDIDNGGNVYVQVEQTPSKTRFGVAYYDGATQVQIDKAKQVAMEANKIIGNYDGIISTYNINRLANRVMISTDEDGEVYFESRGRLKLGRLDKAYIDEEEIVGNYGKTMKDMTAGEIIQNALNNMPNEYKLGLNSYGGGIFSV